MTSIAELRARLRAIELGGESPFEPLADAYPDQYGYFEAFPVTYVLNKIERPYCDDPIMIRHHKKDRTPDVLIKRECPYYWGYQLGKHPEDDPFILELVNWCRSQKMFPKMFTIPVSEEASDFLLRFAYPIHRRRFIKKFPNIDAVYRLGIDTFLWLENNCAAPWFYRDERVMFDDETDRTLFHTMFPELRSISTWNR